MKVTFRMKSTTERYATWLRGHRACRVHPGVHVVVLSHALSDGVVTIRPATDDDVDALVAGRDAEFRRFLGEGDPRPHPIACITVDGEVVGWVDYDHERSWLEDDEVNIGYNLFAASRGHGYATAAVKLLMRHLATETSWRVATLLIDPENARSLALAERAGFNRVNDLDGNPYWKQHVSFFVEENAGDR
jgi:Acetyltransferase (GNAT) domain